MNPPSHDSANSESRPIVMKFGGSSVADLAHLSRVAAFIVERSTSQPVVAVVSAMGKTTDALVTEARSICAEPAARELDMLLSTGERHCMALLALAVEGLGRSAVSLTGSQCGIVTDHRHGAARIVEVRAFRILDELAAGRVVIVGGFQGVSYRRDVTTLGRGGSDTTAVALAAALGADCEIYSDVAGIFSADPRQVANALPIAEISSDEMQTLARAGARVLHSRCVQLASELNVALYARSTEGPGQTVVRSNRPPDPGVRAIACDRSVVAIELELDPHRTVDLWSGFAARLGSLGMRQLKITKQGFSGVLSQTQRDDTDLAVSAVGQVVADLGDAVQTVRAEGGLAQITIVGGELESRPDLLAVVVEALAEANVNIRSVSSEALALSLLVEAQKADVAVRSLHEVLVIKQN